ncbi:phosphatidylcholine and lysophosphatidylcholine phospholipase [Coemansia sp. RSA 485]|nr:phosphatidylcholine and lysophosphatidylcholine phospholipase [Coemansia sp. RSA 485]
MFITTSPFRLIRRWSSCRGATVAVLICVLALAATAISSTQVYRDTASTGISEVSGNQQLELMQPSNRNIFVRIAYRVAVSLGMALVLATVVASFMIFDVLLPLFRHTLYLLLHATRSAWAMAVFALVSGVAGLYYFRYYYTAPKRASPGAKDDLKRSDRPDSGFDLHPDVTRSEEEADGASYMSSSLEARGNTVRHGGFPGLDTSSTASAAASGKLGSIGFPADFLSMFMKSISIFGYIEEPVFREFSRQLQTRRLLAGECMFDSEGDRDDQNFYVVIDGQVQVYLVDDNDNDAKRSDGDGVQARSPSNNQQEPSVGTNNDSVFAAAAEGAFSSANTMPNASWADIYDSYGAQHSSGAGSTKSPVLNNDTFPNNPDGDECFSDDDVLGAEDARRSRAILLNVVGPGDVLSSLFSILSLFTEDVPLRASPATNAADPSPSSASAGVTQMPHSGFYSDEVLQHGAYQQTDSFSARGPQQAPSATQARIHSGPITAAFSINSSAAAVTSESQECLDGALASDGISLAGVGGTHAMQQHALHDHSASSASSSSRPPSSAYFHPHTHTHTHIYQHQRPNAQQRASVGPQKAPKTAETKAPRPNVIARATTDTTLAMIPGSAFQRVTRLYPKAAAHILQVILTRLQRVTFATLYDYLSLPHELVSVERALNKFARCALPTEIKNSSVLQQISSLYSCHTPGQSEFPPQSPLFGTRRSSFLSSRTSPAVKTVLDGSGSSTLKPSWKVNHQNMLSLARQQMQLNLSLKQMATNESNDISGSSNNTVQRHRRSGSDADPTSSVPITEDIDALRIQVLKQLCKSLGLDPHTHNGRDTGSSGEMVAGSGSAASTAAVSRRQSAHRRPLPRTEHLLPLLQTMALPDHKRPPANTQSLLEISSLVNELELYHLPDGFALAEQGKRPHGLYIIIQGCVEVTHRDSVSDFTGATRSRDQDASAVHLSEATRRMTELAREANVRIESRNPKNQSKYSWISDSNAQHRPRMQRPLQHLLRPLSSEADKAHMHRPYSLRAGDIVGYLPALTDMAALYTARSRGSAVVGFVSRWALDRISERFPIVLMTLARRLTAQLPPAILNIDYALEWVQIKASQMVYRQGETSDAVYVVLSGRLRAFSEEDGAATILAEYGQGQSVGEPNLLFSEPSQFNLHAIRDSELVRIPTSLFKALMQSAPHLTFHLSRTLALRAAQSLQNHEQQVQNQSQTQRSVLTAGVRSHNRNLKSIAIIPANADVPIHAFAEQLEQALKSISGNIALLDHTAVSRVLGRYAFSRIAGLKIVSWIAELEQRCRLLLHVADGGISSQWTRHCIRHSDFILVVGLGDGDPAVGDFERLLLALKTTARKELVLLHENRSCRRGSTREWLRRRPWIHAHHHVQIPGKAMLSSSPTSQGHRHHEQDLADELVAPPIVMPTLGALGLGRIRHSLERYYRRIVREPQFTPATSQGHRSDLARLARYLCGTSVGVVLSGGGARGIALLGVLQAFEEAGIPVDMVGGTSIGALMSGLYAKTPDSVAIHGPLRAFSRRMSSLWRFLLDVTYPILAYTSGREFNRAIWKVFRETEIEDLWLPFYCMTANITRSRPEVHMSGILWRVVRASMSLGGFVPPLCDENGDMLVDGGYLDNLPVRVMKTELGADMIFAIDIAGENDTSPVRYGTSVSGFWVLLNHLNPLRSYWIPTLSEVQSRLTYASSDRELESAKIADSCVYLRVPPRDVGVLDFGRFDELYRRGYEYGRQWTASWQQENMLDRWLAPSNGQKATIGQTVADGNDIVPVAYKLSRRNSI